MYERLSSVYKISTHTAAHTHVLRLVPSVRGTQPPAPNCSVHVLCLFSLSLTAPVRFSVPYCEDHGREWSISPSIPFIMVVRNAQVQEGERLPLLKDVKK